MKRAAIATLLLASTCFAMTSAVENVTDALTPEERVAEFMAEWGDMVEMVSLEDYLNEAEAEAKSISGLNTTQIKSRRLADPFSLLNSAITSVTGAWSSITSAFGSKYEEQLLESHFDNGWKKFKQKTKVFKGTGLKYKDSKKFFGNIVKMISLPSQYKGSFYQIIDWIQFFDDQTWSEHDTQFAQGKGGTDSSFTMFARNDRDNQKLDVLFLTCDQKFKLADNFLVISQSSSKLGGLFSSSKIKIKKMKAGLKTQDLQFVSSYFKLLAFQQVAIAQGLQPPPDPRF